MDLVTIFPTHFIPYTVGSRKPEFVQQKLAHPSKSLGSEFGPSECRRRGRIYVVSLEQNWMQFRKEFELTIW